ncbi:concanavalin A-like lectin/glucanase domain-containing protein [Podospora appendiculata]|uniref:Concanavalin A-like lectin/glucanase domain-containing protein n=1 Tax=Podospora appendiculata TaxID=314037 RepID=A0AAE1CCQ6_9PEZI|nr:concanavalin A-like lectin/glucanase domain-containing protein [Podospora appendiculata]
MRGLLLALVGGYAALGAADEHELAHVRRASSLPQGFNRLLFGEDFSAYDAGSQPSRTKWKYDLGTSYPGGPAQWGTGEVQTYTSSTANIVITPQRTLQITPVKSSSGKWTSARIESTAAYDFACRAGGRLRVQASVKLGNNAPARQLGIWPAVWMLGSAFRGNYWSWPGIGELDVLESINGAATAWQTIHCGPNSPGGPCNEYTGVGSNTGFTRGAWHTIALDIDRTNAGGSWRGEKVVWRVDGRVVFTVDGNRVNDQAAWTAVTRSSKFLLLNVAVGGSFPDNVANPQPGVKTPTSATVGGAGSAMEVQYVAVFGG